MCAIQLQKEQVFVKSVAIIAAGGLGKRMRADVPKQYLLLSGRPILTHTVARFEAAQTIGEIILVVPPRETDYVAREIVEKYGISKVTDIVAGGKERQDSVRNGIRHIGSDVDIVAIHDGARPFIVTELIDAAVRKARDVGAVTLGVPVKDTVKRVREDGIIEETLKRDEIWLTQTPQVFARDIIEDAYRWAYAGGYRATDDSRLVEMTGRAVGMIQGTYDNIKITTREDLLLAEAIIGGQEQ